MSRISRNISIILRTERMIATRHLTVLRNQSGLVAYAALIAVVGLVMLNVALFYFLAETVSSAMAAFLVAVINFVIAAVILFIASRMNAEHGLEGVTELRDMAISDIEADIEAAAEEARDVAENVRQLARDPVGSTLPSLIGPLISALLEGRARRKGK